jgi:hypothetical protein
MEGGVAIFLLLIILGVGAVIGGGLYFTGAALSLRRGGSDTKSGRPAGRRNAPETPRRTS